MPPRGGRRTGSKKGPSSSGVADRLRQAQEEKERKEAEARALAEAENKKEAEILKIEGNDLLAKADYLGAVEKYTDALSLDSRNHVLYSNRSAANLHLMRTRDAVRDAEMCTTIKPDWVKGWNRMGAALVADKNPIQGVIAYKNGLKLEPSNADLKKGLAYAEPLARAAEEKKEKEAAEKAAEEEAQRKKEAEAVMNAEPVIGIDLGTTYSCCAWWGPNGVEILTDEDGSRTVPSYVGWGPNGEKLVGSRAKAGAARQVGQTVYDVKRIIGQRFGDDAVNKEVKRMPYKITEDENRKPVIEVTAGGKDMQFAPEEISAMVLQKMKSVAEAKIGKPVKKAVITVPAYFNDAQRNATKNAGAIAGLEVLRIINEPTAAALAYGLDQSVAAKTGERGMNILVFDLGGGTFDVSVLRIDSGVFEVKATGGDTRLGGEDFDNTFQDWIKSELNKKHKLDISNPKDIARIKAAAERAKRELSSSDSTMIDLMIDGDDYSLKATREKFENINQTHFNRCLDTVKKVLKDGDIEPCDVDEIVLVGGSTRVPRVQEMLSEFFGGRQLCRTINPDEAVAFGAAVQGAILSGVRHSACQDIVLVDVTPLSLGIEVEGKQMSVIIPRNTAIPCKKQDMYTTCEDYEDEIDVRIFEGERPKTQDNHLLGDFTISGIERAKRGEPKVLVTFSLDSNGILEVTAVDQKTEATANCTISNACKGLSPEEIERMLKEAEENAKIDAEVVKKVEIKSEIENAALEIANAPEDEFSQEAIDKAEEALDFVDGMDALTTSLESLKLHHKELMRYFA